MIELKKWAAIRERIVAEKGAFSIFGLFQRENGLGLWDVVVAAPWMDGDRWSTLDFVSRQLEATLTREELLSVSRIVILDSDNPTLEQLRERLREEKGAVLEMHDVTLFGLDIEHAYVFNGSKNKHKLVRRSK